MEAVSMVSARPDRAMQRQYLSFTLHGEDFAVGILSVKEIIEYGGVTRVPSTPRFIRGVINLRGAVVPIIDLGERFGKGPATVTKRTTILILEVEHDGTQQEIGVMVDAVNAVIEIPTENIEPPPAFGTRIQVGFIAGMGRLNDRFHIILNVEAVLSIDEIAELLAPAAARPGASLAV